MREVGVEAGSRRIVQGCVGRGIQVEADGVFDSSVSAIVEEACRHRKITQRGCPEFVTVRGIARNLLQAEVLVVSRAIEKYVSHPDAEKRGDLRHSDGAILEIAEHLVRPAGNRMATYAARLAEEQQRTALL